MSNAQVAAPAASTTSAVTPSATARERAVVSIIGPLFVVPLLMAAWLVIMVGLAGTGLIYSMLRTDPAV